MEKRNIYLNLPCELIEKIDSINKSGDRSEFIADLLNKQIKQTHMETKIAEK